MVGARAACRFAGVRNRRAHLLPSLLAVVASVALLSGCGGQDEPAQGSQGAATVEGSQGDTLAERAFSAEPGKLPVAPTGSVTNSNGRPWSYRGVDTGKITLVYFGYTNCPDVCPTTMADIASALAKLPASVRGKVAVQLVSTDPERDTGPRIKQWLAGFDPSFQGGRAPIAQVVAQARAYGIGIEAPRVRKGDYEVTHGAQVVALRPGGDEVGYFRELAGPDGYAAVLPGLVKKWA